MSEMVAQIAHWTKLDVKISFKEGENWLSEID